MGVPKLRLARAVRAFFRIQNQYSLTLYEGNSCEGLTISAGVRSNQGLTRWMWDSKEE